MKEFLSALMFAGIVALLLTSAKAARGAQPVEVVLFYGNGCPHCVKMKSHLEQLQQQYPEGLTVKKFEVFSSQENLDLLKRFAEAYDTEIHGVPTLFIGKQVIKGNLQNRVDELVEDCRTNGCPSAMSLGQGSPDPVPVPAIADPPAPPTVPEPAAAIPTESIEYTVEPPVTEEARMPTTGDGSTDSPSGPDKKLSEPVRPPSSPGSQNTAQILAGLAILLSGGAALLMLSRGKK